MFGRSRERKARGSMGRPKDKELVLGREGGPLTRRPLPISGLNIGASVF